MLIINRKYFPSKKFIYALSTAILLILLALGISYFPSHFSKNSANTLAVENASSTIAVANSIDSDSDGLPDWQEVLYGTDPHNSDTSGDGMTDGEKIKENLDPLKPNTASAGQTPSNQIDPATIAAEQKEISDYANLNPTDKIAHDLFSNIIANQPTTGSMSQDTMNSLVTQAMNELPQPTFTSSTTIADLNIIPIPASTSSMAKAINTYEIVYLTQTEMLRQILNSDLVIIQNDLAKSGSITDADKIQQISATYTAIATALKQAPIPATTNSFVVVYHLELVQDIEKLAAIDNDIALPNKDSASVLSDLGVYNGVMDDLTQTLSSIDAALGFQRK